jgi:hypothetical protein
MAIELSGHSFLGKLAIKHIIIALFIISCPAYLILLFGSYIYEKESSILISSFFAQI